MTTRLTGDAAGCYSPGTTKRGTLNMYDGAASLFQALPDGPYEAPAVGDQGTAQRHFAAREIKLKDRHGLVVPPTSYTDHYPPKGPLPDEPLPDELMGPGPATRFTSTTEYNDEFFRKPRMPRPVEPRHYSHKPAPWLLHETTNQATYKAHPLGPGPEREARPAASPPPAVPNFWETTYKTQFVPKQPPPRQPQGQAEPKAPLPWLASGTTYMDHYVPKDLALQPVFADADGVPYPFLGITEYMDQYVPKDGCPSLPPLTGVRSGRGLQLPLPRRSLGVEFWHRGASDQYYVLIPRASSVPCTARQVFTTLHDDQDQACILVLYGDDPVASNNVLLGQFDIVNIPPAPKDVPRIEVRFHLDKACYLTVEAKDLDTERHKLWMQRGEVVVLRE
ncbi:hypothetical protein V8C86DRAFT_2831180 [Haematococcus lacustris]